MTPANIFITGASRGVGFGLVVQFLKHKDVKKVFATVEQLEDAKDLTCLNDSRVIIIQLDVTSDESIEKAYKEVEKTLKGDGLNLLINNAGIYVEYAARDKPDRAAIHKQIDVNTVAPVIITQVFLPLLQKASSLSSIPHMSPSRAAVINISSVNASIALNDWAITPDFQWPSLLAYRISKSGLNAAARVFANEFIKDGILVASFHPGWVKTKMGGEKAEISIEESTTELVDSILKLTDKHSGGYFQRSGEAIPF